MRHCVILVLFLLTACLPTAEPVVVEKTPVNTEAIYLPTIIAYGPYNILWITVDDLSVWGMENAITPNLDRLAAEGITFSNAHVNGVSCNASRVSVATGLLPGKTGITNNEASQADWRNYLEENYLPGSGNIQTIYHHFHDHGYFVAAGGKVMHSIDQQSAEPWDVNIDRPLRAIWPQNYPLNGLDDYIQITGLKYADWGAIEDTVRAATGEPYNENDLRDHQIIQDALTIIDQLPNDSPYFLNVGFFNPHQPHYVPQRLLDLYPLDSLPMPPRLSNDLADVPQPGVDLVARYGEGDFYATQYIFDQSNKWKQLVSAYLAATSYVDEQLGILMDEMESRGLLENTIVVLWSDHGYHLGEKEGHGKATLWRQTVGVPLFIRVPNTPFAGEIVATPVSMVDIFPTLTELADLPMPSDFPRDGRSLVPLLNNPNIDWPYGTLTSRDGHHAYYTEEWSYIRYSSGDAELYNLMTDPHQWINLLSPLNGNPQDYAAQQEQFDQAITDMLSQN